MYSGAKRVYYKWFIGVLLLGVFVISGIILNAPVHAATGINQELNFEGRLLNAQGATVPDGYYNMQFKIYQDGDGQSVGDTTGSPAGTLDWTETYLNSNSNEGVMVKNGYMSVNLGSLTPFGNSVNWNDTTLWLSVNIGNTNTTCTPFSSCVPDGEMIPMKRLSSTPYALNSGELNGLTSTNFVQLAQGVQTDATTNTNSIYINKTGTGNIIDLQSNGTDSFMVSNAGDLTFGSNANHNLSVATAAAGTAGNSLTVSAGAGGTGAGTEAGGNLSLQGGAAGGTNSTGGNINIDAGAGSGSGSGGNVNIGISNASTIQIGSTTLATGTQTVNVGTNNTAGSATNVTVGSGSSATAGTTTVQGKGNVNVTSASGNVGITATAGTMGISSSGASTLTSTGSTVGINSNGNTTIATGATPTTRATFDTANDLYLGNGVTVAAPTNFTVQGAGSNVSTAAGGNLTVQGGAGNTTGTAGTATLQGGTAGTSGTGGTAAVAGANGGTTTGAGGTATVTGGTGGPSSAGGAVTVSGGSGGTTAGAGGNLTLQGGAGTAGSSGGTVSIQGGTSGTGTTGAINIGTTTASTISMGNSATTSVSIANTAAPAAGETINIGSTALAANAQTINLGYSNTAGGTTNVNIGSGSTATGGTTAIQSKGAMTLNSGSTVGITSATNTNITATAGTISLSSLGNTSITTNSVARATFDNAGDLYFGNGVTAAAPSNFSVQGTASSTTAVAGGSITIQGGNATVGNANGGNLTLAGGTGYGTGVNGLVVLATPTFSTTANDANCYTGGALVAGTANGAGTGISGCTFASSSVNNSAAILAGFNDSGQTAALPNPTNTTAGRVVYITAASGSNDFTLSVNGGGTGNTIAMRQNTTATMIWNGAAWTAAGASSSTTLQSAYNNTLQSAGGAELVVSHTSNTNGLTIRDSLTNPVNGTLLSVQTASASWLLSVNDAVTEYSTDGGAETAGGTSATFPASTWNKVGSASNAVSRYTTTGSYIATGQASVADTTTATAGDGMSDTLSSALTANMHYNVSFTARLSSGIFTDMNVYYSVDGTTSSVACLTGKAIETSVWTKVNCSFQAPASGITSSNAILITQNTGVLRTFYVDNLSVTIAANYSYDTDGGVDNAGNFATNWPFVSATTGVGSTFRNTSDGQAASDSAGVTLTTGATNAGISNKLSINPLPSTLYEITVYAKVSTGTFTDFTVRYTRDGSTGSSGNYVNCVDYSTQVVTTTGWTQITCYVTTDGTAATNPYVDFVEGSAVARTYYVDTFSMTLATNTTPNVQIGGGVNGGPVTLLTLDQAASAPIASNNVSLLGSMYYDTTLGKLQCYEAEGWGACGSSGDTIVTISPEYTNAVLHGTGVGTMTSDICSGALAINDGSSGQPTICAATETYNFYKWTSPQASAQTYGIYVTYQLPTTFKSFDSGQTSLMGRTDSANSTVQYQVYRNDSASGLTACGSTVAVSTGAQTSWQIGVASGAADPSTCGFIGGDSIVFRISVISSQNANAYVSNLNFAFSNH